MTDLDADWTEAAPSVIRVAEELLNEYHPKLKEARIAFIFRKEAQKVKGQYVYGGVSKISAKEQVHLDYDFLVWISKEDWEAMPDEKRRALMDHQLCHLDLGLNGWTIKGHDVEEFLAVIERHGMWNRPLQRVAEADLEHYQQMGLELVEMSKQVIKSGGKLAALTKSEFASPIPAEE